MKRIVQVKEDDVRRLLCWASPCRNNELIRLLDELDTKWMVDREAERILFQARPGQPNEIVMGLKCSRRLQVHAYAAAIIFSSLGKSKDERDKILRPVDDMLNWAVGVDVTGWVASDGIVLPPDHVLRKTEEEIPDDALPKISEKNRIVGEGFYRYATAWILFHELGHLKLGHSSQEGFLSLTQEKEADMFAANWMVDAATNSGDSEQEANRLNALTGIALALLWLTIFNVFFGRKESTTHPEGYDRLFQVLDQFVDPSSESEYVFIWESVATLLFVHMRAANYQFDEKEVALAQPDPRDRVNYFINRISKFERE
ncbi:phage exclusion protein Lit family protein [Bremerella alba]|uniref:Uncharacterized protein n=1 Tax=Bremerella alba TaxID=980252 RepID=A0A7V9A8T0_9BACT|nr:phage exclusion protein Lit family protein [Bremerella alba]MBA2116737.1 hypothetical protein [Bremerella alba]